VADHRRIGIDLKHEGRRFPMSGTDMLALAERAEAAGFESVWTNEDVGFDAFTVLSAMAQRTDRIALGTAIVNVYSRSAMQLAMAAATLDELSQGRFTLGISAGHHPWNDLGHGIPIDRPLSRIREYVAFMRKAFSGEAFTHEGPVFRGVNARLAFDPVRPNLPIHVAAVRPKLVTLAGEIADGLIVNVVSPEYISDVVMEHFRAGARSVGRDPERLHVTSLITCVVTDDEAIGFREARAMVGHRLRASTRMIDTQPAHRHDEIRAVHALMRAGDREAAEATVSVELARSIVTYGGSEEIAAGIDRHFAAGATRVVCVAYPRSREAVDRLCTALAPMLGGGRPPAYRGS
jgi:alkanesulfonate monooxygenase SsuD/methylene tetrahydromethanopterin reductase-like flavin-dependent oxidoreductase (luciferase family)